MLESLCIDSLIAANPHWLSAASRSDMKTYVFRVELEPDEEGWRAFYPPLEGVGASTWGNTKGEALSNIQEVLSMNMEEKADANEALTPEDSETVSEGAFVAVTL